MQVRVAFTGAHSTGKSTLLTACKEHFGPRLHAIENIARTLIARGLKMGDKANPEGLLSYLAGQLDAEHNASRKADLVISDRTCIDSVAYCQANERLGLANDVPNYVRRALEQVAIRESSYYDLHVYFPIEFEAAPDPVRPPAGEYRALVDKLILQFLDEHSIYFHVATGDRTNRAAALLRVLSSLGVVL